MSCSPTSDKCDKFDDYFCSTYLEIVLTAVVLKTAVLASCPLQLCCGIRFTCIGEFQRLLPLSALVLRLQLVLRLVCDVTDVGILRAERSFVILDFFFVILDVLEVISET